jgi:hypothetical protein
MTPMTAYGVVHYLLRKVNGPASKHWCVDCGKPARHWAYDHRDAFERIDLETRRVFSVNFDHYQPMCGACHQRLDMAHASQVLAALAELDAAGVTAMRDAYPRAG